MTKRLLSLVVALALFACAPRAQATHIQSSGTLPAHCTVGDVYIKTGTGAGFYSCLATDVWTSNIIRATVLLSDAQIKALPTTPIVLIPAPGAGLAIRPLWATAYSNTSGGAYTNIDAAGSLAIRFATSLSQGLSYLSNDTGILQTPAATGLTKFLGTTTPTRATFTMMQYTEEVDDWGPVPFVEPISGFTNLALQVDVDNGGSGNFTGGNGANKVTFIVGYLIEAVP